MKIVWRTLLALLLLLLLLLPATVLYVLLTERGTQLLVAAAQRFTPLEIQYSSGSLGGQLQIEQFRYQTEGLSLALDDVLVVIDPDCLWRGVLCFRQLQAARLDIAVLPAGEDSTAPPEAGSAAAASQLIVFPIPMAVAALEIASVDIRWPGGQWLQGPAHGAVRILNSLVELSSVTLLEPVLTLEASSSAAATDTTALPPISLPLELVITRAELLHPTVDMYGEAHALQSIHLQGAWHGSTLRLLQMDADGGDLGELSLHGALDFSADWALAGELAIHLAQPPLPPWMHGREATLSFAGDLASLALTLSSPGTPDITAQAEINALDPQLPFTASMSATAAGKLLADFAGDMPSLLDEITLESPLSLSATGSVSAQEFKVQAAASGLGYQSLQLSVAARHEQGRIVLNALSLQDIAGENQLGGAGEMTLGDEIAWSLAIDSPGLDLPQLSDYAQGRLAGRLNAVGSVRGDRWKVAISDVDLHGEVNNLPAQITGFAGLENGLLLSHSSLEAELNGAQLKLQTAGHDQQPGHLELGVDDLGRWLPGSGGQLQLQAEIAAGGSQYQVSGTAQGLHWRDFSIEEGTISGKYRPAEDHMFELDGTLTAIAMGESQLHALRLQAAGNADTQSVTVASQGDIAGQLSVGGTAQDGLWQGSLAPTLLHTALGDWQLPEAVAITWSAQDQRLTLAGHCWIQEHVRLCPGDWSVGQMGGGSAELFGDLAFLQPLLPEDMQLGGAIQAVVDTDWNPDEGITLEGRSQLSSPLLTRHFAQDESATTGWDRSDTHFRYDRNGLQLDSSLQHKNRKEMSLALALPPTRAGPISGSLELDHLQLAPLAPFLAEISYLEGNLTGQVQLLGTADAPLTTGKLSLAGGRLALAGNPSELEKLDLSLDFQGDWARVNGSATLGEGELQLTGRLDSKPELRLKLSLEGHKHVVLYPPSTELLISENLEITAQNGQLGVTGDIVVHEGKVELDQLPEGGVALSSDVVQIDVTGKEIREELPFDISLNIRVRIEDRLSLTGSLLQTTLQGDLNLRQRPGQPLQLFGSLSSVSGEIRAYQRRLVIKRGVISFSGTPNDPTVDVRAQRQISGENVIVGIQVQGRLAGDLAVDVYSDPVMSQGDAMSYLIRGQPLDNGAATGGTAMALSLAGGVVNQSTLVSSLNRVPGVNDIAFGADGSEEDTTANVSGYVGERIYLSYGLGIYQPITVLTARLYLRTRLWLEVVSELENSLDLYYSFDID